MLTAVIILTCIVILLLIMLVSYRRQIKKICRQIVFMKENDTNMKIWSSNNVRELNELEEEINNLVREYKSISLSLKENQNNLKNTITYLSHDIRTPLTSLDGYFQLLLESHDADEQKKYETIIQKHIKNLKDMLEELFTYTKLQNDNYKLEFEKMNFSKLVFETAFSFYNDFEQKNLEPEVRFTEEQLYIYGNEDALVRIIQNLIKNTLVHGDGEVGFRLEREGDNAVFCCYNQVNHGENVDVSHVFEQFYKSNPARTRTSSGLGLAVAKQFTEKMRGSITADFVDRQFCITVKFPII